MKTPLHTGSLPAGVSIATLALAAALLPAAKAVSITLTPASQDVAVGSPFDLALRISGLGDYASPSFGAFDIDVNFDPILTQFDSFTFGDPGLGDLLGPIVGSLNGSSLNSAGSLNAFSISLDDPADLIATQPGEFTLGTLHFTTLSSGIADFNLANLILGDENGDPLSFTTVGADVRIHSQSVPEGSVGWIGALTVGFLLCSHRRLGDRPSS